MGSLRAFLGSLCSAVLPLAMVAFWACSSSSSGNGNHPDSGPTYKDDSGLEHTPDGGLSNQGCFDLGGRVVAAKINAKDCANVPNVCTTTVDDECGCPTYVEDPNTDYTAQFKDLAQQLADSNCPKKCGDCAQPGKGICEPQSSGPPQCTP